MAISFPEFSHAPIDIHSHFNHGSPYDVPAVPVHNRSLEFMDAERQRFGITCVGMSTFASVLENYQCVAEENLYLHQLVQKTDSSSMSAPQFVQNLLISFTSQNFWYCQHSTSAVFCQDFMRFFRKRPLFSHFYHFCQKSPSGGYKIRAEMQVFLQLTF